MEFEKVNDDILVYALTNPSDTEFVKNGLKVKKITAKYEIPIYSLREQLALPYYYKKLKADFIHYPNFNSSFCPSIPFVVTICDLIYYLFPEACPNKLGHLYAKAMLRHSAKKSKSIITISSFSKNDIIKYLGVPEAKVNPMYIGVNQEYHPVEPAKDLLKKYHIRGKYILYLGNHEHRKNIVGLIKAYFKSECRKDYYLVIGGKKDLRRKEIYEIIDRLAIGERVVFTGYIQQEDIPALYSAADLFVFPSFYEGFGLPPLEAMACGTPVVCSNAASLPESVGDAAIMVEPEEIETLAGAMDRVLENESIQKHLIARGFEQAKKFSWENTARATIKVYQKVLACN